MQLLALIHISTETQTRVRPSYPSKSFGREALNFILFIESPATKNKTVTYVVWVLVT